MSRSTTINADCGDAKFELFFGTRNVAEDFAMPVNTDKELVGDAAIAAMKRIVQLTKSQYDIIVLGAMIATATMQQQFYEETVEGFQDSNYLDQEFKDAEIEACEYMKPKLTISYRD